MKESPLESVSQSLSTEVSALEFGDPVAYIYNPLDYAWKPHQRYLQKFGQKKERVLLLGMNPGPFGMAQTGVPFGDVDLVRDWMEIEESVGKPPREHPKRPVEGFQWHRNEVSGGRLWGWARDRFGAAENFFEHFYVHNYVPLLFVHEAGRNLTPNKIPIAERRPLLEVADKALKQVVEVLEPTRVIGIGVFAEKRAKSGLKGVDIPIGRILHPSPASPKANKGWVKFAEEEFAEQGIDIDQLAG